MDDILKCYQTLGVSPGTSPKALKRTYRELVKRWHPDRFPNDPQKRKEAEEKIKGINVAFERILDHRETLISLASRKPSAPPSPPRPRPTSARASQPGTSSGPPENAAPPPRTAPPPRATEKPPGPSSTPAPRRENWILRLRRLLRPASVIAGAAVLFVAALMAALRYRNHSNPSPRADAPSRRAAEREVGSHPVPGSSTAPQFSKDSAHRQPVPPLAHGEGTVSPVSQSVQGARPAEPRRLVLPLPWGEGRGEREGSAGPHQVPPENQRSAVTTNSQGSLPQETIITPAPVLGEKSPPLISDALKAKLAAKQDAPAWPVPKPEETPEGQFQLARRYAGGDGRPQDYVEAARLYRLAAEAGHAEAQKNLGFLYAAGKGVAPDLAEAEKWFRKAGAKGNAGASFASGLLALAKTNSPRGPTPLNRSEASDVPPHSESRVPSAPGFSKEKPADTSRVSSETAELPEAKNPEEQFQFGLRHAKGEGVRQDYAEAAKWYRLAAEAGHAGAQKNLGLMYASGKGVTQDYAEAEKWLRKAEAKGTAGAGVTKSTPPSTNSIATGAPAGPAK